MKIIPSLSPGARLPKWAFAGLATSALISSPPVFASNLANVSIGDFFFSPTAVTINNPMTKLGGHGLAPRSIPRPVTLVYGTPGSIPLGLLLSTSSLPPAGFLFIAKYTLS